MKTSEKQAKPRILILDLLRGFSILSMVAYHTMYDLVYMFGIKAQWYTGTPGYIWQQSICWVFILVAGASLHYSRSVLRHGIVVCLCAAVLTLVTYFIMPNMLISFGVLHMLGLCMLLFAALRGIPKKINPAIGFIFCAVLFVLLKGVPAGFVGVLDYPLLHLPRALYSTAFLFPLGLPNASFVSSDYFPLVPWLFLFFAGYFAWALIKHKFSAKQPGKNPLAFIGRHSIIIYMAHQPVIYGMCALVFDYLL